MTEEIHRKMNENMPEDNEKRTKCPDCVQCLNCSITRCNMCRPKPKKDKKKKCCDKKPGCIAEQSE